MKRVLTVQDISCIGKCSLTVALPIISAYGVETAIMPTAVLSTHTQFKNFTFLDLTDELDKIANHWKNENISFDIMYSGYLGSIRQVNIVDNIFKKFKNDKNLIVVDPAMADNGKLYYGFDQAFADKMATLCKGADIIVPNLTEASFMLKKEYVEKGYSENYVKETLKELVNLGCKTAVLTGIELEDGKLGVYAYDSVKDEYLSYFSTKLPVNFHGTGDIYSSALVGALAIGKTLKEALAIAVDYTVESIRITMENKDHNWYGVEFEKAFPYLIDRIK